MLLHLNLWVLRAPCIYVVVIYMSCVSMFYAKFGFTGTVVLSDKIYSSPFTKSISQIGHCICSLMKALTLVFWFSSLSQSSCKF